MFTSLLRKPRRAAPRRVSRRPQVEALEDRTVPSIGSPFSVSASARDDRFPATASAANGMSVAVWQRDDGLGTGHDNIYAQMYNANHFPVGGTLIVANTTDHEDMPDVAMDASGNFVVVWTRDFGNSGDLDAQYARFSSAGVKLASGSVASSSTLDEVSPQVAMNAAGKFVVTYTTSDGVDFNVLARRYDASGTQLGNTIKVAARADCLEADARIDRADKGRFAITYRRLNPSNFAEEQYYLTRYAGNGTLLGKCKIGTVPNGGLVSDHDVAIDNKGNCTVVYDDHMLGGDLDIVMRRVTADGALTPPVLLTGSADQEYFPSVAVDRSDGDFVLTCAHTGPSDTHAHVFVREFSKKGIPRESHNLGNWDSFLGQGCGISIDGLDRYFVAYEQEYSSSDNDIAGRFGFLA